MNNNNSSNKSNTSTNNTRRPLTQSHFNSQATLNINDNNNKSNNRGQDNNETHEQDKERSKQNGNDSTTSEVVESLVIEVKTGKQILLPNISTIFIRENSSTRKASSPLPLSSYFLCFYTVSLERGTLYYTQKAVELIVFEGESIVSEVASGAAPQSIPKDKK